MNNFTFEQLIVLYRALSFQDDRRTATLRVTSAEQITVLQHVLNDEDENYGITIHEGDPDNIAIGNEITLNVTSPRISFGILAWGVDELLKAPKARIQEPNNYYVINLSFSKRDNDIPALIHGYRKIIDFIGLLKTSAAYLDESKHDLIFIDNGKFEVAINYSTKDLETLESPLIDNLINAIVEDTHKEQKLTILGNAVVEISKSFPPKERFQNLLSHLKELVDKFNDGYRLFVSSFSYEKIKDELEAAKVDYMTRIHKVISDIQNQLLALPVATIIVATQMKDATDFGYNFWINTSVLIGCYIFVILTGLLLYNQIHTLSAIGMDIGRQKYQMENKYREISNRFTQIFSAIEKRLKAQQRALICIAIVLGTGFVISHIAYFNMTAPAKEWANNTFSFSKPKAISSEPLKNKAPLGK